MEGGWDSPAPPLRAKTGLNTLALLNTGLFFGCMAMANFLLSDIQGLLSRPGSTSFALYLPLHGHSFTTALARRQTFTPSVDLCIPASRGFACELC